MRPGLPAAALALLAAGVAVGSWLAWPAARAVAAAPLPRAPFDAAIRVVDAQSGSPLDDAAVELEPALLPATPQALRILVPARDGTFRIVGPAAMVRVRVRHAGHLPARVLLLEPREQRTVALHHLGELEVHVQASGSGVSVADVRLLEADGTELWRARAAGITATARTSTAGAVATCPAPLLARGAQRDAALLLEVSAPTFVAVRRALSPAELCAGRADITLEPAIVLPVAVVSQDGAPLHGATVVPLPDDRRLGPTLTTAADGTCVVACRARHAAAEGYMLLVRAAGLCPRIVAGSFPADGPLTVSLALPQQRSVRLVGADGAPLAGVRVSFTPLREFRVPGMPTALTQTTVSDAQGLARCEGPEGAIYYEVCAQAAAGALPVAARFTGDEMLQSPDLVVAGGSIHDVEVTDQAGRAVGGADLYVVPADTSHTLFAWHQRVATTGTDGRAQVLVPPRFHGVCVCQAPGRAPASAPLGKGPAPLVMRLTDGVPLVVQAVDEQGNGMRGVLIVARALEAAPGVHLPPALQQGDELAVTGPEGTATVLALGPGQEIAPLRSELGPGVRLCAEHLRARTLTLRMHPHTDSGSTQRRVPAAQRRVTVVFPKTAQAFAYRVSCGAALDGGVARPGQAVTLELPRAASGWLHVGGDAGLPVRAALPADSNEVVLRSPLGRTIAIENRSKEVVELTIWGTRTAATWRPGPIANGTVMQAQLHGDPGCYWIQDRIVAGFEQRRGIAELAGTVERVVILPDRFEIH